MAADVVGYSRLMGNDEARTRARFNGLLDAVVRPGIDEHRAFRAQVGVPPSLKPVQRCNIHGELLKLGIDVSQATVTRYMVRQGHNDRGLLQERAYA